MALASISLPHYSILSSSPHSLTLTSLKKPSSISFSKITNDCCYSVKSQWLISAHHLFNIVGKGQGKTFQTELMFKTMGVEPVIMSEGELVLSSLLRYSLSTHFTLSNLTKWYSLWKAKYRSYWLSISEVQRIAQRNPIYDLMTIKGGKSDDNSTNNFKRKETVHTNYRL